jgi:hypothetical protein
MDLEEISDWIALGERDGFESSWRGPSNPRDRVFEVPAGDLVIVWDTAERVIWEANVSLGRASWHTWTDVEADEEVSGFGLELVRVAAFPCYVSESDFDAIAGPTNDAGRRTEGRITLHRIPTAIGADFWKRIVDAAAESYLDREETGS